jgi:hypothetical protein
MTAAYSTGSGTPDQFYLALRTAMLANGWTEHDVISNTTGARDVVFKSSPLDATALNCAFIRVRMATNPVWGFNVYTDWDATTHVGMNAGVDSQNFQQSGAFAYWIRVNEFAVTFCNNIGGTYKKWYAGFVRRALPANKAGMTKTTQGYSAGVATMNVASDMTAKLKVGQWVQIINYNHTSGSANASNSEKMVIQSIASGSITFTGNTTLAYDTGAIIGENVLPVISTQVEGPNTMAGKMPVAQDGFYQANGLPVTVDVLVLGSLATPSMSTNEYVPGMFSASTNGASSLHKGFIGYLYHWICTGWGSQVNEDIMDDGTKTYMVLFAQAAGSFTGAMGPRE